MVWARGDLNFEVVALRTVHNMNVKQGMVLQQLIAKELIVADALADACAQFNRGDLTTREKRMLRDKMRCTATEFRYKIYNLCLSPFMYHDVLLCLITISKISASLGMYSNHRKITREIV